jgi:hypothetical protein
MKRTALAILALLLLAAACSGDEKTDPTPVEKNLGRLSTDLEDGVLTQENPIPGEQIGLRMEYRTDYDVRSWRITDSKTLAFSAHLSGEAPAGTTVLIEHVHVDVNLDARIGGIDGMPQDSMDDSLHTGTSEGFLITAAYPYEDVFAIEGLSKTFIDGWGFVSGGTGYSEVHEKALTEGTLRNEAKVQGNKFQFVYDVLIRYAPGEPFHKRVVVDEFIVPVGG